MDEISATSNRFGRFVTIAKGSAMFCCFCLALILLPLLAESLLARRWRGRTPVRVHVHGSRGKSSTVREIAALLRASGQTVLAKTTGDAPEYILPDGSIRPVPRIGQARIQEHMKILRMAAKMRVDALVVEGMALQPETVWQSENILRATHTVIVNTRPDHAETMGEGREGVVRTLSLLIPEGGKLFTSAEDGAEELAAAARNRKCDCVFVPAPAPWLQPRALAEAVAADILGQSRNGLSPSSPERSSLRRADETAEDVPTAGTPDLPLRGLKDSVLFRDFLSANDVESSALLAASRPQHPEMLRAALLCTRADRPLRTKNFLDWLTNWDGADIILPVGGHAGYAWLHARRDKRLMRVPPWRDPAQCVANLLAEARKRGLAGVEITGLGNAHDQGEKWRKFLRTSGEKTAPEGTMHAD